MKKGNFMDEVSIGYSLQAQIVWAYVMADKSLSPLGFGPMPIGVQSLNNHGNKIHFAINELVESGLIERDEQTNYILVPKYLSYHSIKNPSRELNNVNKYKDFQGKPIYDHLMEIVSRHQRRLSQGDSAPESMEPQAPTPHGKDKKKAEAEVLQEFDNEVWSEYPRKVARKAAFNAYCARRRDGVANDELVLATRNYRLSCETENKEERFIMHGATFFGPGERWKDYLGGDEGPELRGLAGISAWLKEKTNG